MITSVLLAGTLIPTLLLGAGIVTIAFAMVGVRLIFLKSGEFRGTCATNNPMLKERGVKCDVCKGDPDKCSSTRA